MSNKSYDSIMESSFNSAENNNINMQDVEFLQLRYTDILGRFLAKYAMTDNDHLQKLITNGIGTDGSSVEGFTPINDSDLLLIPDRHTLRLFPFAKQVTATVISDVYRGYEKGRLLKDPRYVSQKMEEQLAENGLVCQVGAEVECFIFDKIIFNDNTDPADNVAEIGRAHV